MLWPSCSLKAAININSTAHFCKEGIKALGMGDPGGRGGESGPVESSELMCQCGSGRLFLLAATLGSIPRLQEWKRNQSCKFLLET